MLERHRIGFFFLLYLVRMRRNKKTSYGESLPKKGCLVLNHSTGPWVVMMDSFSLGRVFGGLRLVEDASFV